MSPSTLGSQMSQTPAERKAPTNAHDFDLEELAQYFHLPINEVAAELGVCATVLKKICRKNGIKRWPHRKIKSIDTMVEALESVVPSSPEEQKQILADIATLREKRAFLEKNPNASYKSVVPKYAINAYNARLQKSGGVTKPARKKAARNSQARSQPYKTRYRGAKSVPTYYFAEEEDRDAAVPDVTNARRSLITSQDEFAAAQLLQLKDINSGPTLLEVAKAAKTADMDICAPEPVQEVPDESAQLAHFVTTLPKMRFKRRWEQEHSPAKAEQSVPSMATMLPPMQNQQVPGWLGGVPRPEWSHSNAVPSFGSPSSNMALF
mmetsp:Transcript_7672/g.10711  ORF Transcript_7672/g.10711 Transcript_7672/m.10711 type:complete len:322 (+) Transcript_7672:122-1087(+)